MRARALLSGFPTVTPDTPVIEAARLLADQDLPGTQVLRLAVPSYCIDDPALARVVDERHADRFLDELADRQVRAALPREKRVLRRALRRRLLLIAGGSLLAEDRPAWATLPTSSAVSGRGSRQACPLHPETPTSPRLPVR